KGDHLLPLWQTPVKEIVEGPVVIGPAFFRKMTLVTDEKSRVFVVLLKFNHRKMVFVHDRGKLPVKLVTSGAGNARVIIKIAGQGPAENEWPRLDSRQTPQKQVQVDPCR